jgi:hypothetical protein
MRLLNFILFLAAVAVVIYLGAHSDSSGVAMKDPNPMKANAEQFSRMQQTDTRFAAKTP